MSSTIQVQSSPTQGKFFLRTILPVSQRDYIGNSLAGGWIPKYSWFINNTLCQTEIVTRRANGCPDTIELIAKVDVSNEYEVTHKRYSPATGSPVISNMSPIKVRCRLNDLRTFEVDFTDQNLTILRGGVNCTTVRLFDTLKDNFGEVLFGVHLYITQYKDQDSYELDVRVTNGNVDDIIGGVYFHSLEVLCGNQYVLVPRKGSKRANSDGNYLAQPGQWFFPKQGQLHRRYIVADAALAGNQQELDYLCEYGNLGFMVDGYRSWYRRRAFGPTKVPFGKYTSDYTFGGNLNGRELAVSVCRNEANAIDNAFKTGNSHASVSMITSAFGPFHPYFEHRQGAHGGKEISHTHGYTLSQAEYMRNILTHHGTCERQPWVIYKGDGTPKTAEDFAGTDENVPFVYKTFDPAINYLPQYRNIEDYNNGSTSREIENWLPHDSFHQARYTKRCQMLVYLGNDMLAKDDMLMTAELNLLELHLFDRTSNGWAFRSSLKERREHSLKNKRQGSNTGRNIAWQIDAITAYYTVASNDWRDEHLDWFKKCTEMLIWSQMPTGWVSRKTHWSQVTSDSGFGNQIDAAQVFELEFEDWAKYAISVSVFKDTPHLRYHRMLSVAIVKSARTLFNEVYNDIGFPWYVGVGTKNGKAFRPNQMNFVSGGPEVGYGWFIMLFAYYASKDMNMNNANKWLDYFVEFKEVASSEEDKIDKLMEWASSHANYLPAAMPIIGEMQR